MSKWRYVVVQNRVAHYLPVRPRRVPGGYIDHDGRRYVGSDVVAFPKPPAGCRIDRSWQALHNFAPLWRRAYKKAY